MSVVTFAGRIIIPGTSIEPVKVVPNSGDNEISLTDNTDIVIHAIYVSNPNPVTVNVQLRPRLVLVDKNIEFDGIFNSGVTPVPFMPPIGPFGQGKVVINVSSNVEATDEVVVNIQYSKVG